MWYQDLITVVCFALALLLAKWRIFKVAFLLGELTQCHGLLYKNLNFKNRYLKRVINPSHIRNQIFRVFYLKKNWRGIKKRKTIRPRIFCALSIKIYCKIFGPRVFSKMCENRKIAAYLDFHTFLKKKTRGQKILQ
jgi:hypothetical protein